MGDTDACTQCGKVYELTELLRGLCPVCLFAHAVPDAVRKSGLRESLFEPPKIQDLSPHFPQLEILELVGQGGMSAVYKARQTNLDRNVAVKLLPPEVAERIGGLERFQKEARTLAQLSHPNIVDVYDAGQAGPWCFIVMEYVDGPNLRQLLGDSNLPSPDVLRIASEICEGLEYAHDRGVVHRDVKPENVLIDVHGHVKLVDFGLARTLKSSGAAVTQTGQVMGTPHYLAPEQMETPASVDHRADVYSLGVLMYEMLTGELPLGHFEPPSRRIGSDPALDAVVLRAMSKDRRHRYQSVQDVRAGMAASTLADNTTAMVSSPSTFHRTATELFLSLGSLFAGLAGAYVLFLAMDEVRDSAVFGDSFTADMSDTAGPVSPSSIHPEPHLETHSSLRILPVPVWFTVAFAACLGGFLLARVNVASRRRWSDLSLAQVPSVPSLLVGYMVLGTVLLLGPGLALFLIGSLPAVVPLEHWTFLGIDFAPTDRLSWLTPYWLRVDGASMITIAAWNIGLALAGRTRPSLMRKLFHPTDDDTTSSLTRTAAMVAAIFLAPIGCVLLYASGAATH